MQFNWFQPLPMLELSSSEVHVWRASTNVDEKQLKYLQGIISEEEQRRAAKFYFEKDRIRFIVARGYLRMILAYYLDQLPEEFRFSYNKYGKPSLEDAINNDVRFNLSHSDEMILYGFTRCREIGVDIELTRTSKDTIQILDHFFSELEKEDFKIIPEQKKKEVFYVCWTRKEAYIKARGKGLSIPLDDFSVTLIPGYPAKLIKADKDSEESQWHMKDISAASGFAAAAVVSGTEPSFYYFDAIGLFPRQNKYGQVFLCENKGESNSVFS
jgi:4'-phosphopantetheinyl transferase